MTRSLDDANRAVSAIRDLPHGLSRIQSAEHQVRLAESEGPDGVRAYALGALVEAYHWGGEPEKSFVAFARLLRWFDERPELVDEYDRHMIFWTFKWMVSTLAEFPTVTAEQIDRTLADMERRYVLAGNGMDAVAYERFAWARERGAPDVEEAFEAWRRSPRDDYSQCEVCEPGDQADWLIATGRLEEGVRLVEATLDTGKRCATEPADMLALVAEAYLDLGRGPDAARALRRAVTELATADSDMARARGRRIRLTARAGDVTRALRFLEEDQHLLLSADTPAQRLTFLLAVGAATHVLRAEHGERPVELDGVPAATLAELDDWVHGQAQELAEAFDARNGTRQRRALVDAAWATTAAATAFSLDVIPPGGPASVTTGGRVPATPVPGASASTGALFTEPASAAEALVQAADTHAAAGALEDAVPAYLQAAAAFEARGALADAGFAWAEAARAAHQLSDEGGAATTYATAVGRLRGGGVAPELVAPVLVAWAQVAVHGDAALMLRHAAEVGEALDAPREPRPDADPADQAAGRDPATRRAALDLADARARVLATLGGQERSREAIELAQRAAEGYAGIGRVADAAHAFWLAGRLHDGLGEVEQAVWNLESAMEGFGIARVGDQRALAASDLVEVLHRSGQHARAEQVAADLTGPSMGA